jgi:hypothetical protein
MTREHLIDELRALRDAATHTDPGTAAVLAVPVRALEADAPTTPIASAALEAEARGIARSADAMAAGE